MTVKELLNFLSQLSPEALVFVHGRSHLRPQALNEACYQNNELSDILDPNGQLVQAYSLCVDDVEPGAFQNR